MIYWPVSDPPVNSDKIDTMTAALKLATALCLALLLSAAEPVPAVFRPGARILFQGDSITDMNRGRTADPNHILGHSYAFLIAARYGAMLPERHLVFLNRGVSGNKVSDLAVRWQKDTLDLKPDVLSILVGINDVSHQVPLEDFEKQYDQLLAATLAAEPHVQLVLGEPFTLPVGKHKEDWETWRAEVGKRQDVVKKLAAKYHAALVHYQKVFDDACQRAPADYWIWDGIHPTYSGQQLMADAWIATVQKFWLADQLPQ
jgi:lysophospholipase L1-like esterase